VHIKSTKRLSSPTHDQLQALNSYKWVVALDLDIFVEPTLKLLLKDAFGVWTSVGRLLSFDPVRSQLLIL
jgi:hypothetical protein